MVREIDLMQRQIDDKENNESVSAILDEGTDDNVEFYLFPELEKLAQVPIVKIPVFDQPYFA